MSLVLVQRVKLRNILCKLVIQLRKLFDFDFFDIAGKDSRFPCQGFLLIFLREGHIDFHMVFGLHADQLLFKARDKGVGAQSQRVIGTLAAFKGFAVHGTVKIQRDAVSVLGTAVCDLNKAGVLLLLLLNLSLDLFVRHFDLCLRNLYALILSKGDIRFHSNLGRKDKRFARLQLNNFDLRLGDDLQIALLHCLAVFLRDHIVGGILKEDARAIHPLDHLAGCFSLTETGKRNASSRPQIYAVHRFLHGLR